MLDSKARCLICNNLKPVAELQECFTEIETPNIIIHINHDICDKCIHRIAKACRVR